MWSGIVVGLAVGGYFLAPAVARWVHTELNTVSTDDAYINGHVTSVAPQVAGRVSKVLVDDNQRVKKGDLLVQLDKEPYEVQVNIKKAAVVVAETDLGMAEAQARSLIAQTLSYEASLDGKKATLALGRSNFRRGKELAPSGGIGKEDLDQRQQNVKIEEAAVEQALQTFYASRVSLGLPAQPAKGHHLADVAPNLKEEFNERLVRNAPAVKQSEAKLLQARRDLDQALLNLRYCDIVSDIDGQVTRRNVNPGNYLQVGQALMAVRSVTEIWIDANFKETQLAQLCIGQRVKVEVDMYGGRREFEGRITGFTMGTGQSLALLPPQNATGNFVKIVQRLPVRVELTNYQPDESPLFIGLSATLYVYFKEPPTGAHAGDVLQPYGPLPQGSMDPKP